jgi:hypothetical protein
MKWISILMRTLLSLLLVFIAAAPFHVGANGGSESPNVYAGGQVEEGNIVSDLVKVDVSTYPKNFLIVVDGVIYAPGPQGKVTFNWEVGSTHVISILEKVYYTEPGARLVFKRWSTGETETSITVKVRGPMSIVALYERQFYVEVVSPYGNPSGSGWYPEGSRVNLTVEDIVYLDNNTRMVFSSWSTGQIPTSPDRNYVYVFKPVTVKAEWIKEYKLSLRYDAPAGSPVLVGSGWYKEGSVVKVRAEPEVALTDKEKIVFERWRVINGNMILDNPEEPSQLVTIDGPLTLEAVYAIFYYVDVKSPYGSPKGSGFYRNGSIALITIESPVEANPGVRYVFSKWSGDIESTSKSVKVFITKPMVVIAEWKKQYMLKINSEIPAVRGEGWYYEGSMARIYAEKEVKSRIGTSYIFKQWDGDYKGYNVNASIYMDAPKEVTAIWRKSYIGLYQNIGVALVVIVGLIIFYRKIIVNRIFVKSE